MNDQITRTSLFGRIGNLFRRQNRDVEIGQDPISGLLDNYSTQESGSITLAEGGETAEGRTTFLRPWVKRDQAIDQLQNGVTALSDLMGTIRETLEKQSDRQDEWLNYLSSLPAAIESIPESNRVQGEALKAIQQGIEQQNTQGNKLASVLERMHESDNEQRLTLDGVRERIDSVAAHEEAIGQSLNSVSMALHKVSTNTDTSARVLENLRENISSRDSELERVIRRQNTRFTTMLTVAIVMSMAALTAVTVFGYLGYETLSHMVK